MQITLNKKGLSMQKPVARRIFKTLAWLALSAALGVVAVLAALRVERGRDLTLPAPTGPYAVGRAVFDWVDAGTVDDLAPAPATAREVLVWMWYPAAGQSVAGSDYLPALTRAGVERDLSPLFRLLTRDLAKVHAHSVTGAAVSPRKSSYPVVIMRGGASAEVWNYSTLAEDLASHGYFVVGIDAPWRTSVVAFPDGRVVARRPENNLELSSGEEQLRVVSKLLTAWTADIGFVLDRLQQLNTAAGLFARRLDLAKVGVFGHSFGGAQTAQFCHSDARCKAGIDVDGRLFGSVVQEGIHKPFMFLMSSHGDVSSDPEGRRIMAEIHSVYDRLPPDERLLVSIRGANHFTFSDDGALLKSHLIVGAFRKLGLLGIDGPRQLAVTTFCIHTFFDAYLKGAPGSHLKIESPLYPEIEE